MDRVDLLIHGAAQVVTCASPGAPRRGAAMNEVGIVADGAVAVAAGRIVALGPTAELRRRYRATLALDASGLAVCPGFVDPHTHLVYAGDRVDEFERRIRGESYERILAAGGGILSTVRATRAAPAAELVRQSHGRLDTMLRLGTTTAEVKTGYGLEPAAELKMLEAIAELERSHAIELVPTFMGAHAVPPEFAGRADAYVDRVVNEMLPAARAWHQASAFARDGRPLFVDVFCERNAFDATQTRRILAAAREAGLPLKVHADEFSVAGGLDLALEFGAVSVDHLDRTDTAGLKRLARSDTVGVVLPAVNFNLGAADFANARALVDAGGVLALSTDFNPGSAPGPSVPLAMAIACRYQRLSPAEALNAATINAAHAIGLGDRVGSLEPGKQADLLVLQVADYRQLAHQFGANLVRNVVKKGKILT